MTAKAPHRAIEFEFYQERLPQLKKDNPDVDFGKIKVQLMDLPGKGLVKCALIPKLGEGEYDVDFEAETSIENKEIVDDGQASLRESQQKHVFESLASPLMGAVGQTHEAGLVFDTPGSASSSASRMQFQQLQNNEPPAELSPQPESVADSDQDSDQDSAFDPLASTMLAGLFPDTSCGPASKTKKPPTPSKSGGPSKLRKLGSGASLCSVLSKSGKVPAQSSMKAPSFQTEEEETHDKRKKDKGRGKGARIPFEAEALLEYEGFKDIQVQFQQDVLPFAQGPFDLFTFGADHVQACRLMVPPIQKIVTQIATMDARMAKRKATPKDALDTLRSLRKNARALSNLLLEVVKRDVDWFKVHTLLVELQGDKITVGVSINKKIFVGLAKLLTRLGKFDELIRLTSFDDFVVLKELPAEKQLEICEGFMEEALQMIFTSLKATEAAALGTNK